MTNPRIIRLLLLLNLFSGLGAFTWLLAEPSGEAMARVMGYSYPRLAAAGISLLMVILVSWLILQSFTRWEHFYQRLEHLEEWLLGGDRLYYSSAILLAGWLLAAWCLLFSWLFIPGTLRPFILFWLLLFAWFWLALRLHYASLFHAREYHSRFRLLPSLKSLDSGQRKVLYVLLGMLLVAFLYFLPLNMQRTESLDDFIRQYNDETVIYPILVDTLTPADTFSGTVYRIFVYEDYHYGYPFYALSQLTLLPVVLAAGPGFGTLTRITVPLLRQVTSVLPLLLAGLVVVYLATQFRSIWKAVLLYLFLLTVPGFYTYNIRFWHPDGLNALFVMLVIFYLARDRLRFGRNFYLTAVFCGLSIGTRLYGAFFFLSVGGYLLAGLLQKKIQVSQMVRHAVLFIAVMAAALLLTSPYIFWEDARLRMLEIMAEKSSEMRFGYDKPDPHNIYRIGLDAWLPFFQVYFAANFFSIYLLFSSAAGFLFSRRRIYYGVLMGWVLVLGAYLVYFVAVKSNQYLIPLFLPLYGGVFGFSEAALYGLRREGEDLPPFTRLFSSLVPAVFLLVQLVINLIWLAGN